MDGYLSWGEKIITDFCDENIDSLYNEGYVFTRLGRGVMTQTRSLRIDLDKFELNSENRRVLKKIEGLNLNIVAISYKQYTWQIGKMAKDFYDTKFGKGIFSANKLKELLTDAGKSNFNTLFVFQMSSRGGSEADDVVIPTLLKQTNGIATSYADGRTPRNDESTLGYAICYANSKIIHYSYPFYQLSRFSFTGKSRILDSDKTESGQPNTYNLIPNMGMGMMIMAIMAAKQNDKKYIYLGSAQRPTDVYKLQFTGLEWFNGEHWKNNIDKLKVILKTKN